MKRLAIILAGGQSRRFGGRDKAEIVLEDRRLIDHVYARIRDQVDEVWISGEHDYALGIPVIPDTLSHKEGPTAVFKAAIKRPDITSYDGFLTVPVDGPFVPLDLYRLLSTPQQSTIAVTDGQRHPTFAYWTLADIRALFARDADVPKALWRVAQQVSAQEIMFNDPRPFYNINCDADLHQAEQMIKNRSV